MENIATTTPDRLSYENLTSLIDKTYPHNYPHQTGAMRGLMREVFKIIESKDHELHQELIELSVTVVENLSRNNKS